MIQKLFKRKIGLKWDEVITAYLFILPAGLGLLIFALLPIIKALQISFLDYSIFQPENSQFVGLSNYAAIYRDKLFIKSMLNTALYSTMVVILQTILALILALLVKQKVRGLSFFRTAYFLPVIMSLVVASTVWKLIYSSTNGLLNSFLFLIGLPKQPFLLSTSQALPSLAVMSVWKSAGFSMLIFLGGLLAIPDELNESAKIDGAGPLRIFFSITLPLLKRVTLFVVVITTISSVKVFAEVYLMTRGGPQESTMVILYHIFRTGFRYFDLSYASAMSFILLIIVFGITLLQFRLLRPEVDY